LETTFGVGSYCMTLWWLFILRLWRLPQQIKLCELLMCGLI